MNFAIAFALVWILQEPAQPANSLPPPKMEELARSPSTGMKLKLVKEGYFLMGVSPRAEWLGEGKPKKGETEHLVQISKPFYLGVFEVTQKQYETIMGTNPSWFSPNGKGAVKVKGIDTEAFPVETVTWFDAIEFCNRLSLKDGLPPYYDLEAGEKEIPLLRLGGVSIKGGKGYRLPTEAEWEMACRAGTNTKFPFGNEMIGEDANCQPIVIGSGYGAIMKWKSLGRTEKVGSFRSNKWGIADMAGNAGEWCWDWYDESYYEKTKLTDPIGPDFGRHRVVRGGSWVQNAELARSTCRFWSAPSQNGYFIGFRVARNP